MLTWTGEAERHRIDVPSVPLFMHERHATKVILYGIKHRKAKGTNLDLFGDPRPDATDRLAAYEFKGPWRNRMVLGDSLQMVNSLPEFEGLVSVERFENQIQFAKTSGFGAAASISAA